jgi:catechol 2,3-dioxygenase-like lactoylglutathione lyase family enzyme
MTNSAESVSELRVVLTVDDVPAALAFYRDALGMPVVADWSGEQGLCVVLGAPRATLEIIDARQAAYIDEAEVGRRVAGPVRLAVAVPDPDAAAAATTAAGGGVQAQARATPWGDVNARVVSPDGMQLTLFSARG